MIRRPLIGLLAVGMSLTLAGPATSAQPLAKKKATGKLRVVVSGTGTYQVVGKGIKRRATKTKTFKLPTGKYRIKASSATITPRKVRVKKGKKTKAKVTFATTPPAPKPSPSPTPTPTPTPPRFTPGAVQRISENASGEPGSPSTSRGAVWSPDGTMVAFPSYAGNLVADDTNLSTDIFVKHLATGFVQRISTNESGEQTRGGDSYNPVWSPDSRRIAFDSSATNLAVNATTGSRKVYVKDITTGAIQTVSTRIDGQVANGGAYQPSWSPDGTRIAFLSSATNLVVDSSPGIHLFVKTIGTGAVQRVSTSSIGVPANGVVYDAAWSPDSRSLAFTSLASNLIPGDTNGKRDVFVKTLATGEISRVSTSGSGGQANGDSERPSWSPDGTRIAFESLASDLINGDTNAQRDVFVKTIRSGAVQRISTSSNGSQGNGASQVPDWSPDGKHVAFQSQSGNLVSGDTNGTWDLFARDMATGTVKRLSTSASGTQVAAGISEFFDVGDTQPGSAWSPDSTRILFNSTSTDLLPAGGNGWEQVYAKVLP